MEYLIGSSLTLIIVFILSNMMKQQKDQLDLTIRFRQSRIYEMIKIYLPYDWEKKERVSQSTKHFAKRMIRVIFMDDKAYWINENKFYVADMLDGRIDNDSKKIVDTYSMDEVQLKKIQFIVDKLTEGIVNEDRNPGNE